MKILLAIGGSMFSQVASQMVATRLTAHNPEVLALQVVEPLVFSNPPKWALVMLLKQAQNSTARAAEVLRAADFKADARVIENEIRTGILDMAAGWRADLIVMGSHGKKGLRRFLLGSVAEFEARHASCSVLMVRTPTNR